MMSDEVLADLLADQGHQALAHRERQDLSIGHGRQNALGFLETVDDLVQ